MLRRFWLICAGAVFGVCVFGLHAWGQETRPGGAKDQPSPGAESPVQIPGPSPMNYPVELLRLLAPPDQRGPVTLTPSISISEEYNDNIFLNNQARQWDFITGFSPALTLSINNPTYQLRSGLSFTADVYARESSLNRALDRVNFLLGGLYRATPQLTLNVLDTFSFDQSTNAASGPQGFTTGRQESWTNIFTPGLTYLVTASTTLNVSATYGAQRFFGNGTGFNSDTYGFQGDLGHVLTRRLTGTLAYGFTYLDVSSGDNSKTHTPTVGFTYQLTPTLTVAVSGGPAITDIGGQTFVTPAGSASLVQRLQIGTATLQYTRNVAVAGGFGGTTDSQTASGTLLLPAWLRGLVIVLGAAYSTADSVNDREAQQVDVNAVSASVEGSYQIARFVSVFGAYTFLRQRTAGSSSQQNDVNQNRVRFGLQFAYPINFD